MKYMLDTNICIFLIKKDKNVINNILKHKISDICISSITLSELEYGVEKSSKKEQNKKALQDFIYNINVLPYDTNASREYGIIRTDLEKNGTPIGSLDMLIAAHAKSCNLTLVTNNIKEFSNIKGLDIVDWKKE